METKVFQRGNFIIVDEDSKETPIAIDNFDYDFITPDSVKLKDTAEGSEINAATADLQKENGDLVNTETLAKAYFATFIKQGSSTPAVGGSTSANQLILNDQTAAKKIGYVLDIATAGTPPPYTALVELIQNVDGSSVSYPIANLAADTTTDLAQIFNDLQNDIYYAALDSEKLYFVPVEDAAGDITEILFEDGNEGQMSFPSPYIETTDTPTGALHQLVTLTQELRVFLAKSSESLASVDYRLNYSEWTNTIGNSKSFVYYSGVTPENPSGNKNIESITYTEGTTPKIKIEFEYDLTDSLILETAKTP
jgi:hypothetical protein